MEIYRIENLTFTYPGREKAALLEITTSIGQGEFVTLCGPSGCGKTTLLRQLKPSTAPHGQKSGTIVFAGAPVEDISARDAASKIGFVLQSPENQIVTDKVWHELAFGLECLGVKNQEIRLRVAEMASFFGIQTWFHQSVTELSGGQKQILALASIMVLQPSVLILDEPTSQLDPIAASDFLATIGKINRELGVAVILTEHRLEEALPLSDRAIVLDEGRIVADGSPREAALLLRDRGSAMFFAMPAAMRIWAAVSGSGHEAGEVGEAPVTVRDGANWLAAQVIASGSPVADGVIPGGDAADDSAAGQADSQARAAVTMEGVWFKYEKNGADVIKGLTFRANYGEITAILGGNGTGKTTTLSLITGLYSPHRGSISPTEDVYLLPQNPQTLFVAKTLREDLLEILAERKIRAEDKKRRLAAMVRLCGLEALLDSHPYDLSGGEQQRAALAKVLLLQPKILLLDEPTKGLDAEFKRTFAAILRSLASAGVAVVLASHDVEFCAEYADRCALFFDGSIVAENTPRLFFTGNSFYTTGANRMARAILPNAVTVDDVIRALGGQPPPAPESPDMGAILAGESSESMKSTESPEESFKTGAAKDNLRESRKTAAVDDNQRKSHEPAAADDTPTGGYRQPIGDLLPDGNSLPGRDFSLGTRLLSGGRLLSGARLLSGGYLLPTVFFFALLIAGLVFAILHFDGLLVFISGGSEAVRIADEGAPLYVGIMLVLATGITGLAFTLPGPRRQAPKQMRIGEQSRKLPRRTVAAAVMILIAIPLTLYVGKYYLGDRKYYFISMMIILETLLPFVFLFESRKPRARELVILAVVCAIAIAGRAAFFMLPQFKPVIAIVIVAGVAFGGEAGFLIGATGGFISNMFFGQGPWTPWQMFAFGIVGFLAGVLSHKGLLRTSPASLAAFGAFAALVVYGLIMDTSMVLIYQANITRMMLLAAILQGIPFNLVHAAATVVFISIIARPLLEKLDRIKIKYGLIE